MAKVVHFDIPVDDPTRASAFYKDVFGWDIAAWGDMPYWLATAGPDDEPGASGALRPRDDAPEGVVIYVAVPDIHAALAAVTQAGGRADGEIWDIPGVGWSVRVRDSEGNLIGMFQYAGA